MSPLISTPERPILEQNHDRLERLRFIERLADALIDPKTGKSTGTAIGITGPWGSGKSSVLNLLNEHLRKEYPRSLIVRFDPWLVSGRNDLIAEFFGELVGTLNTNGERSKGLKKLGASIAKYGAQLAPAGNLFIPGLGTAFSGGLRAAESALSKRKSLVELREDIFIHLENIEDPIVVLIDEIDRVDDEEIKAVAQLVRSVVDFPEISYVLAFDSKRVIQALGAGVPGSEQLERGRGYLEKIVQIQIPLPVTFSDEVGRILTADLKLLNEELQLPQEFETIERYERLIFIITNGMITTLRDTQKLVGTFRVLRNMLGNEVDWIDLLGYSALLSKAPSTVDKMRANPEVYLGSRRPEDVFPELKDVGGQQKGNKINALLDESEKNEPNRKVLEFMFPALTGVSSSEYRIADSISSRRTLLTVLRLGLLPGSYSREQIGELISKPYLEVTKSLTEIETNGTLPSLIDRIDELYLQLDPFDHLVFWRGVAKFLTKPDCEWIAAYNPMHETVQSFADILERASSENDDVRVEAAQVFRYLCADGESELVANWLRAHFFIYGLFGRNKRGGNKWFLTEKETVDVAESLAKNWRDQHLQGLLIPCRWSLQTVYTLIDVGVWDDECRIKLLTALEDERAFFGLALMLFGGHFSSEKLTIENIIGYEEFMGRAQKIADSNKFGNLHESVRSAIGKAVSGGW